MRALILNGGRAGEGSDEIVQTAARHELESSGWEVEPLVLRDIRIRPCLGCFGCWTQTPGVCLQDDFAHDIAAKFIRSDLAVLLTPVTFGGYSYELKKALDRCICLISPLFRRIDGQMRHEPRYDRYPRLMGIGVMPHPNHESEEIFKALVGRNATNMHSPAHAAGVAYGWQEPAVLRLRVRAMLSEMGASA